MTSLALRMIVVISAVAALSTCKRNESRSQTTTDDAAIDVDRGPWEFGEPLPGTRGFSGEVVARLRAAWNARHRATAPRTRHLRSAGEPRYSNRLLTEASPYLRQHAHNPVSWYPWGDEAFAAARALGRPILLSIGYSTCHWCHVMEEESFEDLEVARYLNQNYIAIKVDREVRPDIDAIYLAAVERLAGRGGWPMTVWLTPDGEPFFGGTYYPRDTFLRALKGLREAYAEDRARIAERAASVSQAVRDALAPDVGGSADRPDPGLLHGAARHFLDRLDRDHGGTAGRPKFPATMPVRFLLRYHRRTGSAEALSAAVLTLRAMANGGIYDQVGGGFHRYSTDERWLVPHFEKMLYDNALLVMTYAEAHQVTGRAEFARIVRETLRWVERDMTSPDGGFFAATDADSTTTAGERHEGRFFTWTPAELGAALGPARAAEVGAYYGVTDAGNFEGRSILHVADASAPRLAGLDQVNQALYTRRQARPAPLRDDKVLVDWNALMISAHARASLALAEPDYAARAERAAALLWERARDDRGRLRHGLAAGSVAGYLEDHAFLCAAMLDLFEATAAPVWLARAVELDARIRDHFEDPAGGFYRTGDDHERLLVRERVYRDGAIPSGASVHVLNLLRLHELTTDSGYRARAERALAQAAPQLRSSPSTMSEWLLAVDYALDAPKQIVIVAPSAAAQAGPFLARMTGVFAPNRALIVAPEAELAGRAAATPLVRDKRALRGQTTAYVCEQRVCELPTRDPAVFARQLAKTRPLPAPAAP